MKSSSLQDQKHAGFIGNIRGLALRPLRRIPQIPFGFSLSPVVFRPPLAYSSARANSAARRNSFSVSPCPVVRRVTTRYSPGGSGP